MKIYNFLHDDDFGGPAKRVILVGELLLKQNINTWLCIPEGTGNAEEEAIKHHIFVKRIPFTRIPRLSHFKNLFIWFLSLPKDILACYKIFKKDKPDIVHVNGAFFIVPAIAAKLAGIPVVWHLNDTIVPRILSFLLKRFVLLFSDEVVVAAEAVAQHYWLSKGQYSVLYAPVDVDKFRNIDLAKTKKVNDIPKIALIANWNRIKGVDVFVKALSRVRDIYGPVQIHFAGALLKNHVDYCRGVNSLIDDLNLRQFVFHHGFVSSVQNILNDMDIQVLSSISEACPLTVLEGMASGLPLVATDVGGVRELLTPNNQDPAGIIVPVDDYVAMSDAIIRLIEDKALSINIGRNGRRYARTMFSLQACAKKHLGIYQKLFASS